MNDPTYDALLAATALLNERAGYEEGFTADWKSKGITLGYVGNCGPGFDDREWLFFHPNPGPDGCADAWGPRGGMNALLAHFQANTDAAIAWAMR